MCPNYNLRYKRILEILLFYILRVSCRFSVFLKHFYCEQIGVYTEFYIIHSSTLASVHCCFCTYINFIKYLQFNTDLL